MIQHSKPCVCVCVRACVCVCACVRACVCAWSSAGCPEHEAEWVHGSMKPSGSRRLSERCVVPTWYVCVCVCLRLVVKVAFLWRLKSCLFLLGFMDREVLS